MINLPSLKVPHINKTLLLVSAAVLLILALLAYGAIRNVQADRVAAQKAHDTAIRQEADRKAVAVANAKVQSELNIQRNKALAACSVLKQYSVARSTAKLVQYPPVCSAK